MDSSTASAIDNIYKETKNFLIIGLTGRTGSGCTTAAKILSSAEINVPGEGYEGLTANELKKHRIIKRYIDGSGWQPFYKVEVSCVITYHLSILSVRAFSTYLTNFFSRFF
jgi:energy-coupling factor transporter ATP-binding protein EcfA2